MRCPLEKAQMERGLKEKVKNGKCYIVYEVKCQSLIHVQLFATPWTVQPSRLLCPWDSPGKNTEVNCHSYLQEIFPTQGLNLGLLHCRRILYHLIHQGSSRALNTAVIKILLNDLFLQISETEIDTQTVPIKCRYHSLNCSLCCTKQNPSQYPLGFMLYTLFSPQVWMKEEVRNLGEQVVNQVLLTTHLE